MCPRTIRGPQWLDDAGEALDSERKIQAASEAWWAALASAFKGHPAVFSFDLQNEPMWMSGPTSGNPNAPGACVIDILFYMPALHPHANHPTHTSDTALLRGWVLPRPFAFLARPLIF